MGIRKLKVSKLVSSFFSSLQNVKMIKVDVNKFFFFFRFSTLVNAIRQALEPTYRASVSLTFCPRLVKL